LGLAGMPEPMRARNHQRRWFHEGTITASSPDGPPAAAAPSAS
jgi:hypothetical protein